MSTPKTNKKNTFFYPMTTDKNKCMECYQNS